MISESMQRCYGEDSDLTVDLGKLRAKRISYPNSGTLCTIGDLMDHPGNAFAFLVRLTGERGSRIQSAITSPFFNFSSTGDITRTRSHE